MFSGDELFDIFTSKDFAGGDILEDPLKGVTTWQVQGSNQIIDSLK